MGGHNGGGGVGGREHIFLSPKYLDQFLMVLHATFTTGLVFFKTIKTKGSNPMF